MYKAYTKQEEKKPDMLFMMRSEREEIAVNNLK